jgi:hypothetical protein
MTARQDKHTARRVLHLDTSWAASPATGSGQREQIAGHDVPLGLAMTPWRAHPRVMRDE